MAKKKTATKSSSIFTADQINEISKLIDNRRVNIYHVAKQVLGRELKGDEHDRAYEEVEAAGWFKCNECDTWLPKSTKVDWTDMCNDCDCEQLMDEGEEDEE